MPDPAGRPLEEVRAIRGEIERRVRRLLREHLDVIRSDRTAHDLGLEKLLPALIEEFAGERSDAEIRACADVFLSRFTTCARSRTLKWRRRGIATARRASG